METVDPVVSGENLQAFFNGLLQGGKEGVYRTHNSKSSHMYGFLPIRIILSLLLTQHHLSAVKMKVTGKESRGLVSQLKLRHPKIAGKSN